MFLARRRSRCVACSTTPSCWTASASSAAITRCASGSACAISGKERHPAPAHQRRPHVALADSCARAPIGWTKLVIHDFSAGAWLTRVAQDHQTTGRWPTYWRRDVAHPRDARRAVSTEKPDVYPDCEGVGVEIFSLRSNALNMTEAAAAKAAFRSQQTLGGCTASGAGRSATSTWSRPATGRKLMPLRGRTIRARTSCCRCAGTRTGALRHRRRQPGQKQPGFPDMHHGIPAFARRALPSRERDTYSVVKKLVPEADDVQPIARACASSSGSGRAGRHQIALSHHRGMRWCTPDEHVLRQPPEGHAASWSFRRLGRTW